MRPLCGSKKGGGQSRGGRRKKGRGGTDVARDEPDVVLEDEPFEVGFHGDADAVLPLEVPVLSARSAWEEVPPKPTLAVVLCRGEVVVGGCEVEDRVV